MSDTFSFRHVWGAPASAAVLVAVLADVDGYGTWWPQVRRVRRIDEDRGACVIRSVLPVPLRLVVTRVEEDHDAGRLRVALAGDLVGWSAWTVSDGAAVFTQECVLGDPLLARAARLPGAAGLLRANHAAMMRGGERGLRRYLRGPARTGRPVPA